MSFVSHLECARCRARHDHRVLHNLCECGGPLLVEYDLTEPVAREAVDRRAPTMWRFRELLPLEGDPVTLGEGFTPLHRLERFWIKDESRNPTGTFKDRGAACGVSRARELGVRAVALPTAGNAGGAWACYGAAAGIAVSVAMPKDTPEANRAECEAYGAEVTLVDGTIADAARALPDGPFNASTLKEPYRIEGKKTLGLEICEQLGWTFPDAVVFPTGGGVGVIGMWRAFEQLRALGWVEGSLPRLVAVQAAGCAPIVRAFERGLEESESWDAPETIAAGLRVPKALGDFLVLRALRATNGTAVAVTDDEIVRAGRQMARAGRLMCPEGAAAVAGAEALIARGELANDGRVVVVNTGGGHKYPEFMAAVGRP